MLPNVGEICEWGHNQIGMHSFHWDMVWVYLTCANETASVTTATIGCYSNDQHMTWLGTFISTSSHLQFMFYLLFVFNLHIYLVFL